MTPNRSLFAWPYPWRTMPGALRQEIDELPDSVLLADDDVALPAVARKHRLHVPELNVSSREFHREGDAFVRCIPFHGTSRLFDARPSTYTNRPPVGTVVNGTLVVRCTQEHDAFSPAAFFAEQEESLALWLNWLVSDVADHNAHVDRAAKDLFEQRRQGLLHALDTPGRPPHQERYGAS